MQYKKRYIGIGLVSSLSLFAFYLLVTTILSDFSFAIQNFIKLWYFMAPLILGFGLQIGLFFYSKEIVHKAATASMAASTGVSTTSMIACCAHHITELLPFLGITAFGLFLAKYQPIFLSLGLFSNMAGIAYMVGKIRMVSMSKIKLVLYSILVIALVSMFLLYNSISEIEDKKALAQEAFKAQSSSAGNVDFSVKPLSSSEFSIEMNTHSVELSFDLTKISALYDDLGNSYKPLSWEGSEPSGHHRSGTLKFGPVNNGANSIKLVVNDGQLREFEWNIAGV